MVTAIEARREGRRFCEGDVRLYAEGAIGTLEARMLDVSNNGFRASHARRDLAPGREVRFEHRFFVGRARVVWTEEIGGQVQSGFQVVRV